MATFKPTVKYQRSDGFYQVYIRVTHNAKLAYIKTDKLVDNAGLAKGNIKDPFVLQYCSNKIAYFVELLNKVDTSSWNVNEVVEYLKIGSSEICFSDYARKYHDNMINEGHERNARTYELAYQHLERYAGTNKLMFSKLTSTFINGWIKTLSNTARAKEQYPVCVRQIFKQALLDYNDYDTGIIRIKTNPWLKVKIPKSDPSEHRAISMEECRAFFSAPLPESDRKYPLPELGRDVAMMILCLAGINTIDLYFLQKSDYKNGVIGYERRKTRQSRADKAYFEIRVPGILKPIIDKYLDKTDSPFLFNFHSRLSTYDSFNANVNIGIRQICEKVLKLKKEDYYCGYTFRHTWATVAQNECGATLAEVDFGLNHARDTRLARIYVKIDFKPAWELNEKVIEKIFFTEDKSSINNNEKQDDELFRFSAKQLIKGTLYFRGKILASVEDIGFNNIEEVISHLMKQLPDTMPERTMVQIRIENKDKGQKQDFTRIVHK